MSDYNWCHGPDCHKIETQSRIRGTGDNKVLRTIKIKHNSYNQFNNNIYDFFCGQTCLHDFLRKYAQTIADIAPRRNALETPIKVEKEKYESYRYDYGAERRVPYMATRTKIDLK